jgi:murein L,D-transpeptidase YcbB/YkuD
VRVHDCIGKAVALALLSVSLNSCGNSDRVDAEAIKGEAKDEVRAFYQARQWQTAWDGKTEKQLIEIIDGAPAHGLKPELFLKGELPEDRGDREIALTTAALRYASALARGYSDPAKLSEVYTLPRPKADFAPGLAKAVQEGGLADWYNSLPPQTAEYGTLSAEFVRYTRLNGSANPVAGERARLLAVAMERLRWLDRNPPQTRIDVNTAAAFLEYWRNGQARDRRNVVVGEPDWETPQLGSPIFQLVAHPMWRVPKSILEDELAEKSPAYLASQGMEWRDGRLVQLPGPKNSLGDVKFDMRNDHAIYLHDTQAKALFGLPERHRSHGCVRVQDAIGFAFLLAHDDGILMDFQEAMTKDDETFVKMKTEVPVRLMYRTAFVDSGQVRFVEDVYGWDDDVAFALGYVRKPPRKRTEHARGDVGP